MQITKINKHEICWQQKLGSLNIVIDMRNIWLWIWGIRSVYVYNGLGDKTAAFTYVLNKQQLTQCYFSKLKQFTKIKLCH